MRSMEADSRGGREATGREAAAGGDSAVTEAKDPQNRHPGAGCSGLVLVTKVRVTKLGVTREGFLVERFSTYPQGYA